MSWGAVWQGWLVSVPGWALLAAGLVINARRARAHAEKLTRAQTEQIAELTDAQTEQLKRHQSRHWQGPGGYHGHGDTDS